MNFNNITATELSLSLYEINFNVTVVYFGGRIFQPLHKGNQFKTKTLSESKRFNDE